MSHLSAKSFCSRNCAHGTATRPRPPMANDSAPLIRHLTATGFLVWRERVLLHWHRKNSLWLPLGGHIEANEDPVQCVLREVQEESGVAVELFGAPSAFPFSAPLQLPPPVTILLERVSDGTQMHEHIDLIYFCRPRDAGTPRTIFDPTFRWLDAD